MSESEVFSQEQARGSVDCFYSNDTYLRRYVHVARCFNGSQGLQPDLLPPLYDIVVENFGNQGAVIRGIERVTREGGKIDEYAQAWWIRFA